MASKGKSGFGTILAYCATSGGVYTPIAEIRKVSGPKRTVKEIDLTSMDSADGYDESIPGLKSSGEVSYDLIYESAQQAALEAILGVSECWKITLPDGAIYSFQGYLKDLGQETPHDDKMTCSAAIKISGKVTFTAAVAGRVAVGPFNKALSTGAATIDLTATGPGGSVDLTGKKVLVLTLLNPSTNANDILVAKGGTNGYPFKAAGAAWSVTLAPGQEMTFNGDNDTPAVDGTNKTIDLTGTGSQALSLRIDAA